MFEPEINDTPQDMPRAMTLHAHVGISQRDCDGVLNDTHVMTPNEEERAGEFGEIHFHHRVVNSTVNTYSISESGVLTVSKDTTGEVRLSWNETTDEGFKSIEAVFCNDGDCDTSESSHRDLSAERAGY